MPPGSGGSCGEKRLARATCCSPWKRRMSFSPSHILLLILLASLFTSTPGSLAIPDYLAEDDFSEFYAYDKSIPLNPVEELVRDEGVCKIFKVYFNSVNGERVPALISIPSGQGKHPCIVFLHGYGGSKEDIMSFASLVAAEGYAVISIDAEFHGERREEGKHYTPRTWRSLETA